MKGLYDEAFHYTQEINGQYPRPWMTDLGDPMEADCFIVGRNQRNGYDVDAVGQHARHVDALFNRNGQSCRGLYDCLFDASRTRINIDRLSKRLKNCGAKVLETNVVCFSTRMSADLTPYQSQIGSEIFKWLYSRILPKVIIVHGRGAAKELAKLDTSKSSVIEMSALAPPAYNKWHRKSEDELDLIASRACKILRCPINGSAP